MTNPTILYQWETEITSSLTCLNSWQTSNVALFSLGVLSAESSQQQKLARTLVENEKIDSVEKRWKRFLGNKNLPLEQCMSQLTRWLINSLDPKDTIYLLVDETKLQDRFGALVLGIAWEGRCLPVAWRCYIANSAENYPKEGQVEVIRSLLQAAQKGIPATRHVVVLADRGIGTSYDLCKVVSKLGWHYLFRVTNQTKIATDSGKHKIADMVTIGSTWSASGDIFASKPEMTGYAHAIWRDGYNAPWALITNDPQMAGSEYAFRNWQEQSFRDLKSYGWQWQRSRIRKVSNMERLMFILALAYAWTIAIGVSAVNNRAARKHIKSKNDKSYRRHLSLFSEGLRYFSQVVLKRSIFISLDYHIIQAST